MLRIVLLLATTGAGVWVYSTGKPSWLTLVIPLLLVLIYDLSKWQYKVYRELHDFSEAVRFRDFTRYYPLASAPVEEMEMRRAFNEINKVFKEISKEREIHFQYLQHLLDVVDTGILSYNRTDGQIVWLNDSFKRLFGIPFLKGLAGLRKRNPDLYAETSGLTVGNQVLRTVPSANGPVKILLLAKDFNTAEGQFRMVMYQNVNDTIDKTETQAWQRLLSVLTHEIMNSIAPISSLAGTIGTRLEKPPQGEELDDIRLGISTIQRRCHGLLRFAQSYRSLNKVSRLHQEKVYISELFENVCTLLEPTLLEKKIDIDIILKEPQLAYELDVSLMEQVLLNLTLNAIEAVRNVPGPVISLSARLRDDKLEIRVSDNGKGIPEELKEHIFIPFFTTRKKGSGVGLTLSKQIMLLHGGSIVVDSREGTGSTFILQF